VVAGCIEYVLSTKLKRAYRGVGSRLSSIRHFLLLLAAFLSLSGRDDELHILVVGSSFGETDTPHDHPPMANIEGSGSLLCPQDGGKSSTFCVFWFGENGNSTVGKIH